MAKPTQKALPKGPKPFDPNRSRPVPDVILPEPEETKSRREQEMMMAPSQRDNPVRNYCKGGKVVSSRKM